MALITDPDQLNQSTEIDITTGSENFTLNVAGNLSNDGVTGQALYSFLKEEWKDDAALIKFTFPMLAITPEQFEFGNNGSKFSNWKPADDTTRKLIRTAGWREYDDAGSTEREYAGIISLGSIGAADQPYFQQVSAAASTDTDFLGAVNEAVQVFGDATNGNFDYRGYFKLFAREQAKIYAASDLAAIGVVTMTYQVYRFPLANSADLKVTVADVGIDSNTDGTADVVPYDTMDITYIAGQGFTAAAAQSYSLDDVIQDGAGRWAICSVAGTLDASGVADYTANGGTGTFISYTGERQVGANYYAYNVIVDGNAQTLELIYEFVQWSLRQTVDIDAGAGNVIGNVANELNNFIGDTLRTTVGVFVDNFDSNDTNRIELTDVGSVVRTFPFVAAGTLAFNTNLTDDAAAKYWAFFDYTERFTNAGFGISGASGANATLDSSVVDLTAELTNGDYIRLGGFTDSTQDTIWQLTGVPAGAGPWTVTMTRVDGGSAANETEGASVSLDKNPIDTPDAIIVDDNSTTDITGLISASSTIAFDFDYDNNTQGGRTAATDANITVRCIGLSNAAFVQASFTITRNVGLSFSVVSPLERNYLNP